MRRKLSRTLKSVFIVKPQPKKRPIVPLGIKPISAQVGVGMLCASYWRGMWYVCDDNLFPNNPLYSGTASLVIGTSGLAITQGSMAYFYQKQMQKNKKLPYLYSPLARFSTLYCVSVSCVLVWRGAWILCDVAYNHLNKEQAKCTDRHHLTYSGTLSHFGAAIGLLAMGRFSSVLAPPSNISLLKDLAFRGRTQTWKEYSDAAKWFFK